MLQDNSKTMQLGLPKGRTCDAILELLRAAGVDVRLGARDYRPTINLPGFGAKLLKPQGIVAMLSNGSRDVGFVGRDWVVELGAADLVEVLDTRLDTVRLVAAMPRELVTRDGIPRDRRIVVASEYENIARDWIRRRELDATFVKSWGATEVLPPEDADCIIDNTATGSTLAANGLEIIDELLTSSTCLFANRAAMEDPYKRARIEELSLLLRSVLDARSRVMLEVNVDASRLERMIELVPCMRVPTVSRLAGNAGFAVKAAVPRDELPALIPRLREAGGTDVVVTRLEQIVP